MKTSINLDTIRSYLRKVEAILNTYKALLLFLVLALLYGFIALRISILSNAEPSVADIENVQKSVRPTKIPQATIERLQKLEGTNERTQSIFDQARQNPFKE